MTTAKHYDLGQRREVKDKLEAKRTEARALESLAAESGSDEHYEQLGKLIDEIGGLQARLNVMEQSNKEYHKSLASQPSTTGFSVFPSGSNGVLDLERGRYGGSAGSASGLVNPATGSAIRAYAAGDNLGQCEPGLLGEAVRCMLTGDTFPREFAAANFGGNDSDGGYLLQGSLANQVVDLARAASVSVRAGARTVIIEGSELRVARLKTDPTATWRAETVAVQASSPTFDQVTLRPKVCAAIVPVSLEMLEDASNAAQVIENSLTAALGLALDQAILTGTGSGAQPLGILSNSDVNGITSVGSLANFDDFCDAVGMIMDDNFAGAVSDLALIASPRDLRTLAKLKDTTNQPLNPPQWYRDLRGPFSTTTLGTSGNTNAIVGDFSQVLIGAKPSGITIRVLESGSATDASSITWNAASQLMKLIAVHSRLDVAILRPQFLTKLLDITT